MEVEGKNLQEDVNACVDYLTTKYAPNKPTFIRCAGIYKETKINGLDVLPNPTTNSKNLEFWFDDDPRKNKVEEEIIEEPMIKEGRLTNPQVEVITKLEAVLAECADVGIALIGMDTSLLAYNRSKLMNAGFNDDPINAQNTLDGGYAVKDHEVYLDSGGSIMELV